MKNILLVEDDPAEAHHCDETAGYVRHRTDAPVTSAYCQGRGKYGLSLTEPEATEVRLHLGR